MTKVCRQCGEDKQLDHYRKYYQGRSGHYTVCKACEKINARFKYLQRTSPDADETKQIEVLYELLRGAGLRPPRVDVGNPASCLSSVAALTERYATRQIADLQPGDEVPRKLRKWLTADLTEEPDYYQEKVYETLKAEFRPIISFDAATLLPVHDDTWAKVLETILNKFNEYEDNYYAD